MCISSDNEPVQSISVDTSIRQVDVVYFHETKRCQACVDMEKWAYEAVVIDFSSQFENSLLTFQSINIEDSESMRIVDAYGACYTSLYVNAIYDGSYHIVELSDIWIHSDDKEAFMEYVIYEINRALDSLS